MTRTRRLPGGATYPVAPAAGFGRGRSRALSRHATPHRHGRPLRFAGQRWRVAVLVLLVAALLAAGVGGYLGFGLPPAQAVYLAVLALTTEGFGGGLRLSAGEELFTAGLAVLGVTVFLAVVGVIGTALVGSRAGLGRRRRMQRRIDALRDHYIVCAYGRVGRTVAREFEAEAVPYLVIETRTDVADDLQRDGMLICTGARRRRRCCDAPASTGRAGLCARSTRMRRTSSSRW